MSVSGINERIAVERDAALPEAAMLKRYRDYLRGRQGATLTAGQRAVLEGVLGNRFADNLCRTVIQTPANRLTIARFDVDGLDTVADPVRAYLARLGTLNGLGALQNAVAIATLRDGDHALGLRWAQGAVRLLREAWWNGEDGLFLAYDDDDLPAYAAREWGPADAKRRTVYFKDRIERYQLDGARWAMINLPSDPVQGGRPVPWIHRDGSPLGLPIVHFPNLLIPNDGPGGANARQPDSRYGVSELDGGVLGLQDEINDIHRDITAAARHTAYQMLWATGVTQRQDQQGNPVPITVEPGAVLAEPNDQARFGHFPAGSLQELERALHIKQRAVSLMTDVPMHLITGDWPSGEALLKAEMGLVEKVEQFARIVGPAWASVAHKATRLANTFANADLDERVLITTVFEPAQRVNALAMADGLQKLAGVFGVREAARQAGYQPGDIDRIVGELRDEGDAAATVRARGLQAVVQGFNEGREA